MDVHEELSLWNSCQFSAAWSNSELRFSFQLSYQYRFSIASTIPDPKWLEKYQIRSYKLLTYYLANSKNIHLIENLFISDIWIARTPIDKWYCNINIIESVLMPTINERFFMRSVFLMSRIQFSVVSSYFQRLNRMYKLIYKHVIKYGSFIRSKKHLWRQNIRVMNVEKKNKS